MESSEATALVPGRWLRWAGLATLVVAGIAFLLEGFSDPHVIERQLAWAALTVLLSMSGIVALRKFGDRVGARLCLGLAAASVPIHFAQLGSAIWDLYDTRVASFFEVLACGLVVLLLAPALALGGATLVRRWALPFTASLFALGVPLLIPTRAVDAVAGLALVELLLLLSLELLFVSRRSEFANLEGLAARLLLLVPLAILLGRNALHETTSFWLTALLAAPGSLLLVASRGVEGAPRLRPVLDGSGLAFLTAATLVGFWGSESFLVAAAAVALVSPTLARPSSATHLLRWPGLVALALAIVLHFGEGGFIQPGACAALALGYAIFTYRSRSPVAFIASALCALLLFASVVAAFARWPVHFGWLLPALVGLALLLVSSILQAPGSRAQRLWLGIRSHFVAETLVEMHDTTSSPAELDGVAAGLRRIRARRAFEAARAEQA